MDNRSMKRRIYGYEHPRDFEARPVGSYIQAYGSTPPTPTSPQSWVPNMAVMTQDLHHASPFAARHGSPPSPLNARQARTTLPILGPSECAARGYSHGDAIHQPVNQHPPFPQLAHVRAHSSPSESHTFEHHYAPQTPPCYPLTPRSYSSDEYFSIRVENAAHASDCWHSNECHRFADSPAGSRSPPYNRFADSRPCSNGFSSHTKAPEAYRVAQPDFREPLAQEDCNPSQVAWLNPYRRRSFPVSDHVSHPDTKQPWLHIEPTVVGSPCTGSTCKSHDSDSHKGRREPPLIPVSSLLRSSPPSPSTSPRSSPVVSNATTNPNFTFTSHRTVGDGSPLAMAMQSSPLTYRSPRYHSPSFSPSPPPPSSSSGYCSAWPHTRPYDSPDLEQPRCPSPAAAKASSGSSTSSTRGLLEVVTEEYHSLRVGSREKKRMISLESPPQEQKEQRQKKRPLRHPDASYQDGSITTNGRGHKQVLCQNRVEKDDSSGDSDTEHDGHQQNMDNSKEPSRPSVTTAQRGVKLTKTGKIQHKWKKAGVNRRSTAYNRFLQQQSRLLAEKYPNKSPQERMKMIASAWATSDKNPHTSRRQSPYLDAARAREREAAAAAAAAAEEVVDSSATPSTSKTLSEATSGAA